MMEKNWELDFSLKSGLGFGVSVLVSDLNENSGFDRSLLVCGLFGQSNKRSTSSWTLVLPQTS